MKTIYQKVVETLEDNLSLEEFALFQEVLDGDKSNAFLSHVNASLFSRSPDLFSGRKVKTSSKDLLSNDVR